MDLPIRATEREKLKHLLIAFTAGNLMFVRRWYDLERLEGIGLDYYRSAPQSPNLFIATLLAAFLLSVVFYFGWRWSNAGRPWRRNYSLAVFSWVLAYPLDSIRRYWNSEGDHFDVPMNTVILLLELMLLVGGMRALWGKYRVPVAAQRSLVWISLLLPVFVFNFCMEMAGREPESAFEKQASLPMLQARPPGSARVVWVIFDELDQRLAFERRPASVQMPEMDRLREQSIVADHAEETGAWTLYAVPSLLSGRVFSGATVTNARTLRLQAADNKEVVNWRDQPNIFKAARQAGINAEIIGWHHPYCRVMGDQMVNCFSLPSADPTAPLLRETHAAEEGVWRTVAFLVQLQFENLRDLFRSDGDAQSQKLRERFVQDQQQKEYFELRDRAYRASVDPRIGLLILHLPLPHPYAFYNRREKSFNMQGTLDYLDGLALTDRTAGELRLALEQARMWDNTTLLVTSDHGLRPSVWDGHYGWTEEMLELTQGRHNTEVPFILKLAGTQPPAVVTQPINNVVSASLIMDLLTGKLRTTQQVVDWLEHPPAMGASVTRSSTDYRP
jgi:hypothetical protein